MSDTDCSPSCGGSQRPIPAYPAAAAQLQSQPVLAVALPYASTSPSNPMDTLQGQVLQQDLQKPPSEVYGEGASYTPASAQCSPSCSPSHPSQPFTAASSCYSPTERDSHHEDDHHSGDSHPHADVYRPAPVARTTSSQLHRATPQVVRYGQASSDNPDSYMHGGYGNNSTSSPSHGTAVPPVPVVGMVQYGGLPRVPPPVAYGGAVAPGASYAQPSNYGSQRWVSPNSGSAPNVAQYSAAPPPSQYSYRPPL